MAIVRRAIIHEGLLERSTRLLVTCLRNQVEGSLLFPTEESLKNAAKEFLEEHPEQMCPHWINCDQHDCPSNYDYRICPTFRTEYRGVIG